jgi:hypothetical protein
VLGTVEAQNQGTDGFRHPRSRIASRYGPPERVAMLHTSVGTVVVAWHGLSPKS